MSSYHPLCFSPTRFSFGHLDVIEEDLVEGMPLQEIDDRPDRDPGALHVHDEHAHAFVLVRGMGVRPGGEPAVIGIMGVARPDLLAVDDEPVVLLDGASSAWR